METCLAGFGLALLLVDRKSYIVTQQLHIAVACMPVAFTALVQKKCALFGNSDFGLADGEKLLLAGILCTSDKTKEGYFLF